MPLRARSGDDRITATFLRGLTIGALVGAVIAGSSLLGRRRRPRPRPLSARPSSAATATSPSAQGDTPT